MGVLCRLVATISIRQGSCRHKAARSTHPGRRSAGLQEPNRAVGVPAVDDVHRGRETPIVYLRDFQEADRSACRTLLDSLPEWFGLPEANAAYELGLGPGRTVVACDAVASSGGTIIGVVDTVWHQPTSAEINLLAVQRSRRRSGTGRALMAEAERRARAAGARWSHVKTRGPSTPDPHYAETRAFYESIGYEPLYESLTEWGSGDAALVYVKRMDGGQH